MPKTSHLEAVKIQARAVGPIVKALEARLGKDEAHRLVGDAIAESWAEYVASSYPDMGHPRNQYSDFPSESIIATDTDTEFRTRVVHCAFADYFRSIGEPEVGALLTCGVDFAVESRIHPDWTFSRTQTLMMGADHCDFCWKRDAAGEA